MEAPFGSISQGYAGASDVLNPITSNILESSPLDDPDLQSLFPLLEELFPDLQCFENCLYHESCNALYDSSVACPPGVAAQSECKLQPSVYNGSVSVACTYTPPPSGQVVHLQNLQPALFLPAGDKAASVIMPPHTPIADVVNPVIDMPCLPPLADVFHPAHINMPLHSLHAGDMPSHSLDADVLSNVCASNIPIDAASHVTASNMPPHQPPPYQFDADPYWRGNQSHDPHNNSPFSFSPVEANHKNQLPYHAFHCRSKLTSSMNHEDFPQSARKWGLPGLDVPTSPITYGNSGAASSAYMQSSTLSGAATNSDSVAMEISSMSAPAAPATSNSSFYRTCAPSERGSLTVPPSPTPSVNKGRSTRRSSRCGGGVAFNVKTDSLNLSDGYIWKKYGEKRIMRDKFTRSYFKCNEVERCGCEVTKRIQKCNDEESVLFTYLGGRHNHQ